MARRLSLNVDLDVPSSTVCNVTQMFHWPLKNVQMSIQIRYQSSFFGQCSLPGVGTALSILASNWFPPFPGINIIGKPAVLELACFGRAGTDSGRLSTPGNTSRTPTKSTAVMKHKSIKAINCQQVQSTSDNEYSTGSRRYAAWHRVREKYDRLWCQIILGVI